MTGRGSAAEMLLAGVGGRRGAGGGGLNGNGVRGAAERGMRHLGSSR